MKVASGIYMTENVGYFEFHPMALAKGLARHTKLVLLIWLLGCSVGVGAQVSVSVTPRLGAFNGALFSTIDKNCESEKKHSEFSAGADGPLNWAAFNNSHKNKKTKGMNPLAYNKDGTSGNWDVITFNILNGEPKICGYRDRHVLISVKGANGSLIEKPCSLKIDGKSIEEKNSCSFAYTSDSNLEQKVQITISDNGVETTYDGIIPEDVLIVSLGDSFASGEGNPDVDRKLFNSAKWMDPWCHRSAYASSVYAVRELLLLDTDKITNTRYLKAIKAGAITVVNFACSGALVTNGLTYPYAGVITKKEFSELIKRPGIKSKIDDGDENIPKQISQLPALLKNQGKGKAKANPDLLLLSAGGNDLLFGRLATQMFLLKFTSADLNIEKMTYFIPRLGQLGSNYGQFNSLLDIEKKGFTNFGVIVTPYPDLTLGCDEGGGIRIIDGVKVFDWVGRNVTGGIDRNETEFLRTILTGLNDQMKNAFTAWHVLDLNKNGYLKTIQGRGWCGNNSWYRDVGDSKLAQGDMNGTLHPTWELNQLTGKQIASAFLAAINAQPKDLFRNNEIKLWPHKKINEVDYVSKALSFTAPVNDNISVTVRAMSEHPPLDLCNTADQNCQPKVLGADKEKVRLEIDAKNKTYNWNYKNVDFLNAIIYDNKPILSCMVLQGSSKRSCSTFDGSTPIWSNNNEVEFIAKDEVVGIEYIQLQENDGKLLSATDTIDAQQSDKGLKEMKRFFSRPEGHSEVLGISSNGFSEPATKKYIIKIDTRPLEVESVNVNEVDWASERGYSQKNRLIIQFPLIEDQKTGVAVFFKKTPSGFDPTGIDSDGGNNCPYSGGETCLFFISSGDNQKIITKSFKNHAGSLKDVDFVPVVLPMFKGSSNLRDAAIWAAMASKEDKEEFDIGMRKAFDLEPNLSSLAPSEFKPASLISPEPADSTPPPIQSDDKLTQKEYSYIMAAWLNLVSGFVNYSNKGNVIGSDCKSKTGAERWPAIRLLKEVTACAVRANKGDSALAGMNWENILKEYKLLPK